MLNAVNIYDGRFEKEYRHLPLVGDMRGHSRNELQITLPPRYGPRQAVDVEIGVSPGENPFRSFAAEESPAYEKSQDLLGE